MMAIVTKIVNDHNSVMMIMIILMAIIIWEGVRLSKQEIHTYIHKHAHRNIVIVSV